MPKAYAHATERPMKTFVPLVCVSTMEGFKYIEEFYGDSYIPDPNELVTCTTCGKTYDRCILGETIEHFHDESLPLDPILYEVRGERTGWHACEETDLEKLRFDLQQFLIYLSRKCEQNEQENHYVVITANDRNGEPRTIIITAPDCEELALATRYAISIDGAPACLLNYRPGTGEGHFEGNIDEVLGAIAFQWVINLAETRCD